MATIRRLLQYYTYDTVWSPFKMYCWHDWSHFCPISSRHCKPSLATNSDTRSSSPCNSNNNMAKVWMLKKTTSVTCSYWYILCISWYWDTIGQSDNWSDDMLTFQKIIRFPIYLIRQCTYDNIRNKLLGNSKGRPLNSYVLYASRWNIAKFKQNTSRNTTQFGTSL